MTPFAPMRALVPAFCRALGTKSLDGVVVGSRISACLISCRRNMVLAN